MDIFRWLRMVGDTIFAIGAVVLGWFVVGPKTGGRSQKNKSQFIKINILNWQDIRREC